MLFLIIISSKKLHNNDMRRLLFSTSH